MWGMWQTGSHFLWAFALTGEDASQAENDKDTIAFDGN